MALWDKLFKKKDEHPGQLNPIVQKSPAPSAAPRVSSARPVSKPLPPPAPSPRKEAPPRETSESRPPKVEAERSTQSRKKKGESGTHGKIAPGDAQAYLKRGLARQTKGDHDNAIADFTQAIALDGNCVQAYASRGVSRDAKGDVNGAKADYSKSIQIEISNEINRQMRENPEVEM